MKILGLTVAYWAVLVASIMPIACAGIAKSGMFGKPRREGGYDNDHPRAWLARQTDGRLGMQQYPAGQLGTEDDSIGLTRFRAVDMCRVAVAALNNAFEHMYDLISCDRVHDLFPGSGKARHGLAIPIRRTATLAWDPFAWPDYLALSVLCKINQRWLKLAALIDEH